MTTMKNTEKTGNLVSIQAVDNTNDLMIINRSGITIRTSVSDIRIAGRNTQGVKVINIREGDSIASVMVAPKEEEEENLVVAVEGAESAPAVEAAEVLADEVDTNQEK